MNAHRAVPLAWVPDHPLSHCGELHRPGAEMTRGRRAAPLTEPRRPRAEAGEYGRWPHRVRRLQLLPQIGPLNGDNLASLRQRPRKGHGRGDPRPAEPLADSRLGGGPVTNCGARGKRTGCDVPPPCKLRRHAPTLVHLGMVPPRRRAGPGRSHAGLAPIRSRLVVVGHHMQCKRMGATPASPFRTPSRRPGYRDRAVGYQAPSL